MRGRFAFLGQSKTMSEVESVYTIAQAARRERDRYMGMMIQAGLGRVWRGLHAVMEAITQPAPEEVLHAMTDAQLRDFGITRGDIGNAVRYGRDFEQVMANAKRVRDDGRARHPGMWPAVMTRLS